MKIKPTIYLVAANAPAAGVTSNPEDDGKH